MKQLLAFLEQLAAHNNKEWMDAHRQEYLAAKAYFEDFVAELIQATQAVDPSLGELSPKQCTFRINRDIRFSKNKQPYKENMAAFMARGGKKSGFAGYYVHISPQESFIGGGLHTPPPDQLKKIRQEIDYNGHLLKEVLESEGFQKTYPQFTKLKLTRPPKGYAEDNPHIDLLKLKSFTASRVMTPKELASRDAVPLIASHFEQMAPLVYFLNAPLED